MVSFVKISKKNRRLEMSQFVSSAEKHIILLCYVYRARSLEHHDERGVAFFPTPTQVGCLFIGAMFFIWCLVDNIGLFQVTERSGLMAMDQTFAPVEYSPARCARAETADSLLTR